MIDISKRCNSKPPTVYISPRNSRYERFKGKMDGLNPCNALPHTQLE